MGSKKTKTTSNETGVTTPNVPAWFQAPVENFFGNTVSPLLSGNNTDVLSPINNLTKSAYGQAGTLNNGGYDAALSTLGTATDRLSQGIQMPTQQAKLPTAPGLTKVAGPTGIGAVAAPTAQQATVGNYGPLAFATDTSGLAGKDVAQFGGASANSFMDRYMNPLLKDYIDAGMTEFNDQAGRQTADYAAQGAMNKAFGGSRYGIGEAQLKSDIARKGALTRSELYSDAWNKALGAGQSDASNATQAGIASMQEKNQRDNMLADLASKLGIFNAGAANDRAGSIFDARNAASLFNAGEGNDLASLIFGENSQNARTLFDALTGNARQDAGAANDLASQVYGTQADNEQFNVDARNKGLEFGITANQQQARDLIDAANSQANIAGAQGADARANIGTQMDVGTTMQDLQSQQLQEPYMQAGLLQALLDPSIAGLFTGQTINTNGTSTSKQSGGLLSSILGSAAQLGSAAIMASERRVKRDIVKLGEEADGLGVYRYNYIWDDDTEHARFGVMVDEVERIRPWAMGPEIAGVRTVNYGAL